MVNSFPRMSGISSCAVAVRRGSRSQARGKPAARACLRRGGPLGCSDLATGDPTSDVSQLTVERRADAAWITLNRPAAMNALSRALVTELAAALRALRQTPWVRAVVLTGAGDKAFCAGADLKERRTMSLDDTRAFLTALGATLEEIAHFPAPVIAAINGVAFGGGLELALACDLRVATEGAEMGLLEVRLGIIPGAGGTQRLTRIAGVAVAKRLILTGCRVDARRAAALGLVGEVVTQAELVPAAERLAAEIAACAPLAVAAAKRAIDDGAALSITDALAVERARYEMVLVTDDRNEGLAAFTEKRGPLFKGK
jgi:enoyl-CoA hydratase/carnithine racemase